MALLIPSPNEKDQHRIVMLLRQAIQYVNLMLPSQGHTLGTGTNDSAAAGEVGEIINPVSGIGTVSLTTGTPVNLTSAVLTPGDWLLFTVATFSPAATTSITRAQICTSGTTGTLAFGQNAWQGNLWPAFVPGALTFSLRTGPQRQIVAAGATLTIYAVAQADFTVSTMTAGCNLMAIRRR